MLCPDFGQDTVNYVQRMGAAGKLVCRIGVSAKLLNRSVFRLFRLLSFSFVSSTIGFRTRLPLESTHDHHSYVQNDSPT